MEHRDFLFKAKDHLVSKKEFDIYWNSKKEYAYTDIDSDDVLEKYYEAEEYHSHKTQKKTTLDFIYAFVQKVMLSYKASFVNKLGKGTVLDYGSGVGVFAAFLKDRGYDLTTVEPSKSARKACNYKGLVCYSSLDEIPESMSFSTITLWHVLEHLPDLDGILNQLQSRLTPEGSLIIAVPNLNSHDAKYYNSNWAALDVPRHLWHFSSPGLIKLVEQHNLVFESQHPLWFDAFYISYMSEVQKKASFPFIRGIWVGLWSNLKAYTSGQYSSKIYVFKKST